ncbi:ABC transporter substrate-binding protein [Paenibacillus thailandensis]|uniref:ABC transporter substrate-binding protein n=1 Tax=Paenibacillus thailandensis TaxID=393250 RepID=A0ABW5QSQ9_9BACL
MKRKKKTALGLLAAAALLVVTACGSSNNAPSNEGGAEATGTEPFTFKVFSGDVNNEWDHMESDIGKYIKEKTGVTVEQEFPVGGNDGEQISVMIASDEYPDAIMAKGNVTKLVDAGALIDLAPLIDKYGPNLKKVYGEYYNRLQYSKDDPAIYVLPHAGVGQTYFESGGGFQIQHQALEAAGYPEMKTVQDYENAIKSFIEKNPTTEDGQKRIGLSLNGGEWQFLISVTNPAFYATGAPDNGEMYVDPNTYETIMHYQRPEEQEYFRWLNHMNDIGLLDPESFVQKYDQYKAKIATGRVVGLIDQQWDYAQAENTLKSEGKFDQTYARFPITLNESYQDHSFQGTGYLGGYGISITKDAKNPERIIQFLDYLASDEGQVLVNWGIEGVHYDMVDGKRVMKPEVQKLKATDGNTFKKTTGIGNYFLSARYGDGVKDPSGNYYTTVFKDQIVAEYSDADKKTLEAYGATTYRDLWPADDAFPERPYGALWTMSLETASEENVIFQKAQDIAKKRIPEAILADPSEFDAIWDTFQKELVEAGVDKVNKAYTQKVKERIELWSAK